jgi:PAS domain-containing protein
VVVAAAVTGADLPRAFTDHERLESERVRAKGAVGEADGRFQRAFNKAAIGMALVDRNGRGLEANDALSRITG